MHARGVRAHPAAQRGVQRTLWLPVHPGGARAAQYGSEQTGNHRHLARRLDNHPEFELAEGLRNIHRIAEIRLNDKFAAEPVLGNDVGLARALARPATPALREKGQLTVTYLTDAPRLR